MYHDITPQKEVTQWYLPEFEEHLQLIRNNWTDSISMDQLVTHLRTEVPAHQKKPILLLTFDDGYGGHYEFVYPLLKKKYGYQQFFSDLYS